MPSCAGRQAYLRVRLDKSCTVLLGFPADFRNRGRNREAIRVAPDPQANRDGTGRFAFSIGRAGGVSYRWDFGDGSTTTATNPTHR
jgi:hypothetical protein